VTLPVVWTRAADSELKAAKAWYETMRPGLGERFALAVETTVIGITENPLRFAAVYGQWRRAGVRHFPYGIVFRVEDHRIVVLACFHASRDPQQWQQRVE
jgi:plasmid stabilization system protein ParE